MAALIRKIAFLLDRRVKTRVLALCLLMAVNTLMEMLGVGVVLPLFQILVDPEQVRSIPYVGTLYGEWFAGREDAFILSAAGVVLLVFATKNLVLAITMYLQNRVVLKEQALFARNLLTHYLLQPYIFHLERNSAALIRNVQLLSFRLFGKGVLPLLQIGLEAMAGIGVLAVLMMVNVWATIGTAAVMTLCLAAFYRLVHLRMYRWGERTVHFDGEILRALQQALGAVKATKLSGSHGFHRDLLGTLGLARARVLSLSSTAPSLPRLFIEVIALTGMLVLVFVLLVFQEKSPQTILPMLGLFAVGALRLMPAFSRVVQNLTLLRENTNAIETLYEDLRLGMTQEPTDVENTITFHDEIVADHISYSYPGNERPAVDDASFTIPAGASVAFVGHSGSGKTTLVDIILGLLAPTKGQIRVDGTGIGGHEAGWWRRIGYVPQDIYLLDDTIRRNIALGIADDQIDDDSIQFAIEAAQLQDFVATSPHGLETVVGERGTRLSGGQRQRIGIARALYRQPDVLVMDEATSSLDVETETRISDAIRALSGRVTVILVAHRLSTVRHCDRIHFMNQGRVVADGTFDELLQSCPEFREMASIANLGTSPGATSL